MILLCGYGRPLMSLQRHFFPVRDYHNNLGLLQQRWRRRRRPLGLSSTTPLPLPLLYIFLLMTTCLGISGQPASTDGDDDGEIFIESESSDPSLPPSSRDSPASCPAGELRLATPWILRDVFLVNLTQYEYQERQCLASQSAQELYCDSPTCPQRRKKLIKMYLKFCNAYPVYPILKHNCSYTDNCSEDKKTSPNADGLSNNNNNDDNDDEYNNNNFKNATTVCKECIRSIEDLDRTVQTVYERFELDVMSKFDCEGKRHHQGDKNHTYSVNWNCDHCKQAYKAWLCSMYIPYYQYGRLLNPCTSLCKAVEERCPYFLPVSKNQYAGEPAFLCTVNSIEQPPDIYTSCRDGCYQLCEDNHNICPPANITAITEQEIKRCSGGAASSTQTSSLLLLLLLLFVSSTVTCWISSHSLQEHLLLLLGVFNSALGLT
ncbi:uncharacterized protein LOC106180276 isoform X2 [Lingula anatina]|uniref:Uncharacterized protein LOC106180276 isoform X1 n=1 Tax=Lingula anatina TaxID=7574 RepID=A0A1S3KBQ4_LINAN|nr:uncharacterized protein LOC106180276 isoform X1 [Lingula anatina]XP_013419686.1 uncharacterized protein LOC106180276 isoform X2 [Lingula anatina]|eukprot:XP_013419685.1 uncharacterized protein LOC106180276 isoform X1 [Lingula anatina]